MDVPSVLDTLAEALPGAPVSAGTSADMPGIVVAREALPDVLRTLRDHPALQFALLVDVIGVDNGSATPRFEVVYHLACLGPAFQTAPGVAAPPRRLRVRVRVPADDARVPTAVGVFPAANWLEREIFDLFGIAFDGHPDLRRILMPEDWQGYPLRKDYPVQVRKDTATWSPVQVSPEEFAATIRAQRERSTRDARPNPPSRD